MNELEREETRRQVASDLRKPADELEQGDRLPVVAGDESASINPPEPIHFERSTDTDGSRLGGETGRSCRLERGWEADEGDPNEELADILTTAADELETDLCARTRA